ncbi:mitogen-activated protein kinase kinase PBS2 [Aspergillus lucknowensis]|uniref:mitogen-activated protein kinase kinase n=1 Tax=Aspergillus lucknowensis TaxID=176173 RepID=A0ABR4M5H9_9EURO
MVPWLRIWTKRVKFCPASIESLGLQDFCCWIRIFWLLYSSLIPSYLDSHRVGFVLTPVHLHLDVHEPLSSARPSEGAGASSPAFPHPGPFIFCCAITSTMSSQHRDFATDSPLSSLRLDGERTSDTPEGDISPPATNAAKAIPSLRPASDSASGITPSSTHLGQVNAARHGGGTPSRPQASMSSANQDILAKMKAFQLSRQGVPPPGLSQSASSGVVPTTGSQSGVSSSTGPVSGHSPSVVNGPLAGAFGGRLPPSNRPVPKNWASAPNVPGASPGTGSPKGLAAKRMKPGLKLSDATGPNGSPGDQSPVSGPVGAGAGGDSAFSKYSEYIDTKSGTLKFKNKAIVHGGGIEFSSGQSFSISLDEVDRLDELGKGNYGTVYKVRHSRPHMRKPGQGLSGIISRTTGADESDTDGNPTLKPQDNLSGAVMAMKEIRLELDESKFAQIIMELDILHRCVSPFIIDFYGAFFQEGAVYMCVEFMDGGSIDKLYADGIPESILRKVALSTVMGLKSLKDDHNIIHRDVKPTNILVNSRGQIKICDFGVSGNLVASIAKTNIGCQSYMAPERIAGGGVQQSGASGGGTYSVQSDIWSLGLSIIECAIGRYPYPPETFNNIFSQLHAIVHGDPPTLPAEYSDDAHSFVNACLDKNPQKRPSYNMLLRHIWLASLMQPPSEPMDSDIPSMSLSDGASGGGATPPVTDDQEVADWVKERLARRRNGQYKDSDKPALHAVALDAVPGSPLLDDPPLSMQSD